MKRNLSNITANSDPQSFDSEAKKFITKKNFPNLNEEEKIAGTSTNHVRTRTQKKDFKKYGITVNVEKNISFKRDKAFFKQFENAEDIILGRKFFIQYATKEEALKKLKELSGSSFSGHNITARLDACHKIFKNSFSSVKLQDSNQIIKSSLHLSNIPPTVTVSRIKENFPKAFFITKKRKKHQENCSKFFVLKYLEASEAENDLKRSENITFDGHSISAKLIISPQNGLSKPNGVKSPKSRRTQNFTSGRQNSANKKEVFKKKKRRNRNKKILKGQST